FAVRRGCQAIASVRQLLAPLGLRTDEVDAVQSFRCGEVELLGGGAGHHALDVPRLARAAGIGGNPLHELVAIVDVEDEDSGAAELEVIADAGANGVQGSFGARLGGGQGSSERCGQKRAAIHETSWEFQVPNSRLYCF